MEKATPTSRPLGVARRGESAVAAAGFGAAAVVLAVVAGVGWWNLRSAEGQKRESREQTLRASADFLVAAGEGMIAAEDVSRLRTLIAGAASQHHFESIRITLPEPNALVVADSSPTGAAKYPPLPKEWKSDRAPATEPAMERTSGGRARIVAPMMIAGRGPATLEIEDGVATGMWGDWRSQTGMGVSGVATLGAMVMFYRSVRRRFRSLGAISESLSALGTGETDTGVLAVARTFGPEAEAWNALLAEHEQMRTALSRQGSEQKLGDRRSRDGDLFSLCDAMWQGLVLIDDHLRVKYVNGAGAAFLRAKREDMQGKPAAGFMGDPRLIEALKMLASGSGRGRTVIEVEGDKDGTPVPAPAAGAPMPALGTGGTVLRYSIRAVRKEDNAAAVVVIEDVTQQRVADEARHTFVATATHELRTPLTNMRLYIDSLLEEPDQDVQKRTQAINVVSQEAKRLERMVGDMLSVAQIESGTIKLNAGDVRLEPIFEDLKNDFAEQARQKEIKLRFDLPPKWPQMEGDRDKIVMALHNLVGNAVKYTPAGGEVVVRAGGEGKSFTCEVVDNGIGIKDEEQPLVFERFYRAKDKRIANITGTGLGLSIAREVVRLHGGDIALKSAIDKGSTFTMTLPAKAA